MKRSAFTLIELMLASTLSVLLIGGVLAMTAGLSRDARRASVRSSAPPLQGALEMLQWDLCNARAMSQSTDGQSLILIGHGSIASDSLVPNGRLVRVTYACANRGGRWRLTRGQQYIDDPAKPKSWVDLVAQDVSSIEVLPGGSDQPMPVDGEQGGNLVQVPRWVRARMIGPSIAVEKRICVK